SKNSFKQNNIKGKQITKRREKMINRNISTIYSKLKEIIHNAYVPYSNFRVASICKSGNSFYYGVNVENSSYPVTLCGERNAISTAISNGHKQIDEVYLLTDSNDFATPCGMCRQFMSEFMESDNCKIYIFNWEGKYIEYTINDLLKSRFTKKNLNYKGV
ncbi:MAG: cytidine deaminase, partial [Malacoplasma sp.]|nr:cytidine deaminase [Malacoplasma sp.]